MAIYSNSLSYCVLFIMVIMPWLPCCYGNDNPLVTTPVDNRTILNIAFFSPHSFRDINCLHSAVQLAVKYVNRNESILPNHRLVMRRYTIQKNVNRNLAGNLAHRFFQMLGEDHVIQGIVGPAQSKASLALQKFNRKYLIPNIGYAALTDQDSPFSRSYDVRVNPKISSFLDTTLHLFKNAGWKKCAILYSQGTYATSRLNSKLVETFLARLKEIDAKALVVEKFKEDEGFQESTFPKLKKNDVRVVVIISRHDGLIQTFCEAYKHNYYGQKIVYVVMGLISSRWHSSRYVCSKDDLFEAANGTVTFHKVNVRPDDTPTVFGKTGAEVKLDIKAMREHLYLQPRRFLCKDNVDTYGFDAVTNMAIGFHHVLQNKLNGSTKHVVNKYGDALTMKEAVQSFRYNQFEGITGRVGYSDDNERKGTYLSLATIIPRDKTSTKFVTKGYFNGDALTFNQPKIGLASLFNGGIIPIDGLREQISYISLNVSLKYTIWALTCLLVLFSVMFLSINIIHRNRSLIKMSSPNINNIILLGSILCYTTVIMNGVDSSTVVLHYQLGSYCNTVIVVFAAGFTLLFGGLFIKTWRVYRIFTAVETLKTVAIKDPQLYFMVSLMLLIDGIICTAWLLISPYEVTSLEVSRKVINNSTEFVEVYNSCFAVHDTKFEVTMFLYKGLVMLFGLFMAWETRNVNIAALNDSKQIGMSIYGVVVMGILGTICMYALEGHKFINVRYAIVTFAIVVSTFSTVLFVFLPKVVLLYGTEDRLREKERIRTRSKQSSVNNSANRLNNSHHSNSSVIDRHDNNPSVVEAVDEPSSPGQHEIAGNLNVIYEQD